MRKMYLVLFVALNCLTLSKVEHENRILELLNQMGPIAKKIENIKMDAEDHIKQGLSIDPTIRAKYSEQMAAGSGFSQVKVYQRTRSLSTQLQPYLLKLNNYKWRYISKFGQVAYNNFIISNGYEWGLGIYW